MTAPAFATPTALPVLRPAAAPARHALSSRTALVPRASVDSAPPPESRISPNFAASRRFVAPSVSMHDTGVELMNTLGVVMEPVPLDTGLAAELLTKLNGDGLDAAAEQEDGNPVSVLTQRLFPTNDRDDKLTSPNAATVIDRFYPASRRYELPLIALTPPGDSGSGSLTVTIGKIAEAAALSDEAVANAPARPPVAPDDATAVVDAAYPARTRYLAPVISFGVGEMGVGVAMEPVLGEPTGAIDAASPPLFPRESRFVAPEIRIKAPAGPWDKTAFVAVENDEVNLPILVALGVTAANSSE